MIFEYEIIQILIIYIKPQYHFLFYISILEEMSFFL